ncbi:hypothetical protein D3C75_653370 [compost metagenome]
MLVAAGGFTQHIGKSPEVPPPVKDLADRVCEHKMQQAHPARISKNSVILCAAVCFQEPLPEQIRRFPGMNKAAQ